jgi:hypothetical protein
MSTSSSASSGLHAELRSSSEEVSGLQALADERPDLLELVLLHLDGLDLVRLSQCSKFFHRFVEREDNCWSYVLERNPEVVRYLGLPRCFTNRKKARKGHECVCQICDSFLSADPVAAPLLTPS